MTLRMFLVSLLLMAILDGCNREESGTSAPPEPAQPPPMDASPVDCAGPILETMDVGSYTYVKVECGGKPVWAAGPQTLARVGDRVSFNQGMPMVDFHSNTLNRTFDVIFFVGSFQVGGVAGESGAGEIADDVVLSQVHGGPAASAIETSLDFSGIEKPEEGKTVEEIFSAKHDLSGKEVVVRGRVVKFNSRILGKNWIHLQDGSGAPGSNDLTVTTSGTVKVGDVVLVQGKLLLDQDFGLGYRYEVLIEDARITVE